MLKIYLKKQHPALFLFISLVVFHFSLGLEDELKGLKTIYFKVKKTKEQNTLDYFSVDEGVFQKNFDEMCYINCQDIIPVDAFFIDVNTGREEKSILYCKTFEVFQEYRFTIIVERRILGESFPITIQNVIDDKYPVSFDGGHDMYNPGLAIEEIVVEFWEDIYNCEYASHVAKELKGQALKFPDLVMEVLQRILITKLNSERYGNELEIDLYIRKI